MEENETLIVNLKTAIVQFPGNGSHGHIFIFDLKVAKRLLQGTKPSDFDLFDKRMVSSINLQ